jgi:hypothetical protein
MKQGKKGQFPWVRKSGERGTGREKKTKRTADVRFWTILLLFGVRSVTPLLLFEDDERSPSSMSTSMLSSPFACRIASSASASILALLLLLPCLSPGTGSPLG